MQQSLPEKYGPARETPPSQLMRSQCLVAAAAELRASMPIFKSMGQRDASRCALIVACIMEEKAEEPPTPHYESRF